MEFLAIYREYVTLDVMWIGIAVLALIVKCFTKEYVTLCVAIGAIAAFVTSITVFYGKFVPQIIVAVAVTFLLAIFIQPYTMRKNQEQRMRQAREKQIPHKDEEGIVIEKIDNMKATGRIRFGDEELTARTANGMPVAVGEKVHVVDHDRHILLVM